MSGVGSRSERDTLPQPPTAEERIRHQGLKFQTLQDAYDLLETDDPERTQKALVRLAVGGVLVPGYLWQEPVSWRRAFVQGAYEGARFIIRLQRSGGIA